MNYLSRFILVSSLVFAVVAEAKLAPPRLASLRELVRLARQREVWTQAELARRSGVPMTTISRLERTGLASTDTLFKVLFALNRLDAVEDMLKEQLRLVKFPKTLDGDFESAPKVVKRVRHKGGAK